MEFINLKKQYQLNKQKIDSAVMSVLEKGDYIMGQKVAELENRLAEYCGVKHCISCSNGTDAITLSLMAMGIKAGDAVFTTTFTFFATAEVIALVGATPIFVDIDETSFNIDIKKLEAEIIKCKNDKKLNAKAIISVDLFGLPCDYDKIQAIAKKYDLKIIEDSAQGFGATYKGNRTCSFGDIATTSFFPAKPLGCYGDGGAIFTNNDEYAQTIKSLRIHGKGKDKYDNVRIGLNSRLDTIQAAILSCKLDVFDFEIEQRNRVANEYTRHLSKIVKTPIVEKDFTSVWAQYTIVLPENIDREKIIEQMKNADIPTMIYYAKPMHMQGAFEYLGYKDNDFMVAKEISNRVLSLPMHPYLTNEEIETISQTLILSIEGQQ